MFGLNERKKKKLLKLSKVARNLVTLTDTRSMISEQFRTIRTNITFSMKDQDIKTILVTSSTPGEGKSTMAANLGVVFAQDGKRVLIIDADLHKPTFHYTFKLSNNIGLSNALEKKLPLTEVIQETFIYGLSVITSGPMSPNPAELLSSQKMDTFIMDLKKDYDIIIFDAPPLLSVTDPLILSNKCEGTLLIVNSGVVEKEDVLKARAILTNSQTKILGVVLNNHNSPRNKQYYDYYNIY